jgi:hypothetical protein
MISINAQRIPTVIKLGVLSVRESTIGIIFVHEETQGVGG